MTSLDSYMQHFRARVLQDALTEALAEHHLRRAMQLDAARPRPGDYTGAATPEQLAAQDERLSAAAAACRHRATLGLDADDIQMVADALAEVAA